MFYLNHTASVCSLKKSAIIMGEKSVCKMKTIMQARNNPSNKAINLVIQSIHRYKISFYCSSLHQPSLKLSFEQQMKMAVIRQVKNSNRIKPIYIRNKVDIFC